MKAHDDGRSGFASYAGRGVGILLLTIIIGALLHNTWFARRLERANLDALFVLSGSRPNSDIALVEITDGDYDEIFSGTSPLDREKVLELIKAIDDAGARAIGVDLVTSNWPAGAAQGVNLRAPVVWVRDEESSQKPPQAPDMGGKGDGLCQGIPALLEVDGVVRNYFPKPVSRGQAIPSFTTRLREVVQCHCQTCSGQEDEGTSSVDKPPYIGFIGDRSAFKPMTAGQVLASAMAPEWRERKLMKGRIILLGGAYKYARDSYATPYGEMFGVEILANIIASEMTGRTIKEVGAGISMASDLLLGFGLIALSYCLPRIWSLPVGIVGSPVIAVALNIALFSGWRYYLSFMPAVVGVIISSVIEHALEHRRLRREHGELKSKHGELEKRHTELQLELEKQRSAKPTSDANLAESQ
jgi:CHASE2 domain-containing protein